MTNGLRDTHINSRKFSSIGVLSALLLAGFLAGFPLQPRVVAAYTPHAPILIDGEAGFTAANGVTSGTGTPGKPYLIDGWEIDATTAHGIDIRNTTSHFIVGGVYVHSGGSNYDGLHFQNALNGVVQGSLISGNRVGINLTSVSGSTVSVNDVTANSDDGISVSGGSNILIENNNATLNKNGIVISSTGVTLTGNAWESNLDDGVSIVSSDTITLLGDNASDNGFGFSVYNSSMVSLTDCTAVANAAGIYIDASNNVSVSGGSLVSNFNWGMYQIDASDVSIVSANISYNDRGIYAYGSTRMNIRSNVFFSDGVTIWGGSVLHYNSHTITTDNRVNGLPLYYYKNRAGLVVDNIPVGQLIAANCTDVTASRLRISDTDAGVLMAFVNRANVTGNNISLTPEGVLVGHSADVRIAGNVLLDNDHGVSLYDSSGVSIAWNDMTDSGGAGIIAEWSDRVQISGNLVSSSAWHGVYLYSSGNASVWNNSVRLSGQDGIRLEKSSPALVYHNNLFSNAVQAYDDRGTENAWDDNYPTGGNFWSDYSGVDAFSGPLQDVPGPDGIGDTARAIDANSSDAYPLMAPFDYLPPTVSITYPTEGLILKFSPVTVNGTASDAGFVTSGVDHVEARINGGGWRPVSGNLSWNISFGLAMGPNTVDSRAWDRAGNPSVISSVNFVFAPNTPPTASFAVTPPGGDITTVFTVDASSSTDVQDPPSALEVRWDWEDDAVWDTAWSTLKTAQHQYATVQAYTIRLEVRDTGNLTGQTTRTISVNNTSPSALFLGVQGFLTGTAGIVHITNLVNPALNWTYRDLEGYPQIEFDVRVGTSPGGADVWNPPATPGAATTVDYAGPALGRGVDYYLGVKVYDGGMWSADSEVMFRTNSIPGPPAAAVNPVNDSMVAAITSQTVTWSDSIDADGDSVTYEWQVDDNLTFTVPLVSQGTTAGNMSAFFVTLEGTSYYWRVRARDDWEPTTWSAYGGAPLGHWTFRTIPPNARPAISVTSPVGGELWFHASIHDVNWTASDNEDPATSLVVWLNYTSSAGNGNVCGPVSASVGQCGWTIPSIDAGDVVVNATVIDTGGLKGYGNSGPFAIRKVNTPPGVTLTSPVGGEIWFSGTVRGITWLMQDSEDADALLTVFLNYTTGATTATIAAGLKGQESFQWTLPNIQATDVVVNVTVIDTGGLRAYDESGPFTVKPPSMNTPPTVTLISPGGNEVWQHGSNHTVSWTMSDLEDANSLLSIYVNYTVGAASGSIVGGSKGLENCNWTLPEIGGTDARVNVTVIDSGGLKGWSQSGDFTIEAPHVNTPPTVSVTSPAGGDAWEKGTNHNITWTMQDAEDADAYLTVFVNYTTGGVTRPIVAGLKGQESYEWTLPDIESGYVVVDITVIDSGGLKGHAQSEAFTIKAPPVTATGEKDFLSQYWWLLAIVILAIIALIVVVILRRRKAEKPEPSAEDDSTASALDDSEKALRTDEGSDEEDSGST